MRYSFMAVAAAAVLALSSVATAAPEDAADSKVTKPGDATAKSATEAKASSPAEAAGAKAAEFTAKDENGKEHSLADLKGKVGVLVWTNPGAPKGDELSGGCPFITGRIKEGSLEKLSQKVTAQGAVFMAVNSSNFNKPEDSKQVAEKFKQTYPTLQDADGKIGRAFGATNTPQAIVISQDGAVVYSGAINDTESPDATKDASAKDYVSAAVEAALKGEKPAVTKTKAFGCGVKYAQK